jgi:hypothetical protein
MIRVRLDPGIGPLIAQTLGDFNAYRLWLVAHCLSSERHNGSGRVGVDELRLALPSFGIEVSDRSYRRWLAAGDDVLFHIGLDRNLYLASYKRLWRDLTLKLVETGHIDIAEACRPVRRVQLDLGGSLQPFKARLYAAWVQTRRKAGHITVSRAFLSILWNAHPNTLREWETLTGVTIQANYAQYAGSDIRLVPDHARPYAVTFRNGQTEARHTWRMVNTYANRNPYKEHPYRGQLSKARQARNLAIDNGVCVQPVEQKRDGFQTIGRRYIDQGETIQERFKTAQRFLRKRQAFVRPPYVHLQEKARTSAPAFALWELYNDKLDVQQTGVHERDYAAEYLPAFQSLLKFYQECLRWTGLPPDIVNMPIRRFGGWTKNGGTISATPLLTTRIPNYAKLRRPRPKIPDPVIALGVELGGVISKCVGCCPESGWRRICITSVLNLDGHTYI